MVGRGAFQSALKAGARAPLERLEKQNVGISNDKAGEKPARRKTKVS